MNKTETAEWLAENVLGWKFKEGGSPVPVWEFPEPENKFTHGPYQLGGVWDHKLCKTIYSPDGFFAVWDAVIKNKFMYFGWRNEGPQHDSSNRCAISKLVPSPESTAYGDRYEAFYNAVYEAMK